jgi:hypothetical protein
VLDELFHQYLTHQREFLTVAERCSIKGWPDRKPAMLNAWRLQFLYNEWQCLRFEYLLRSRGFQHPLWESMSSISSRIVEDWSEVEEQALSDSNLRYREIREEIAGCRAALDGEAIKEPFEAARRDPEYAAALLAVQDKLRELDAQLAGSSSQ